MKIGIVGFGALGSLITKSIIENKSSTLEISGVYTIDYDKEIIWVNQHAIRVMPLEDLFDMSDCIVEVSTVYAMPELVRLAIKKNKPIIPMSVGGFALDTDLLEDVAKHSTKIFVPSGAVCGVDGLLTLKEIGLESVKITTIKNPKSLAGAPYLLENNIDVMSFTEPKVIYYGTAKDAIKFFPSNVNVAITVSCAGIGFDKTIIEIIADPNTTKTQQILEARAGECQLRTEVIGSPLAQNPKTSAFAFNSVMALISKVSSSLSVGT